MAPSARSVTPLVGRDPEIASLQHVLLEARSERGHLVLVRGEAGVGKTRLVSELVDRADDALVLEGLCRPGALGLPYLPIAQALRAGLRRTSAVLNCADPPGDHLPLLLPELGRPPEIAARCPDQYAAVAARSTETTRSRPFRAAEVTAHRLGAADGARARPTEWRRKWQQKQ